MRNAQTNGELSGPQTSHTLGNLEICRAYLKRFVEVYFGVDGGEGEKRVRRKKKIDLPE